MNDFETSQAFLLEPAVILGERYFARFAPSQPVSVAPELVEVGA